MSGKPEFNMKPFASRLKIKEWDFRPEIVGAKRLATLKQEIPFSSIAQRMLKEMCKLNFSCESGTKEAIGKVRAKFSFSVNSETVDAFFNSSQGCRAHYYLDPRAGNECSRILIRRLKDQLVDHSLQSNNRTMTEEQIKNSLTYPSAKVWIDEDESTLDQKDRDLEKIIALNIPRWVNVARRVIRAWDDKKYSAVTIEDRSLLGVQAPEGTRIKIMGAWVGENDNQEFVVPSKVDRALHIHSYGFS